MKVLRSPIIVPIKSTLLPAKDFVAATQKLHCRPFIPVDRLSNALEEYNILEVLADGRGRNALNDPRMISSFINGQRLGIKLSDNLYRALEEKGLMIFTHEDGLLGVVANPDALQQLGEIDPYRHLTPAEELAEVIDSETKRDSQNPNRLPNLDEVEGNILSADNNLLLAQTISGEDYMEENPDLVKPDRSSDSE